MSGERKALEVTLAEEVEAEAEQLHLFGPAQTAEGKSIEAMRPRGPGRPPGARNKRTERTVAFLLSRHKDPREVLLEIAEANVDDLVGRFGLTRLEALQEKRHAATAVLPYMAQRQPIAIDLTNTRRYVLELVPPDPAAGDQVEDGIKTLVGTIVETIEKSDAGEGGSDS